MKVLLGLLILLGGALLGTLALHPVDLDVLQELSLRIWGLPWDFSDESYEDWEGLYLDDDKQHVEAIRGLIGTLPDHLGNLSKLVYLDLSKNYLSGPIPETFEKIPRKLSLILHTNLLSGELPNFEASNNIKTFSVYSNCLKGCPTEEYLDFSVCRVYNNSMKDCNGIAADYCYHNEDYTIPENCTLPPPVFPKVESPDTTDNSGMKFLSTSVVMTLSLAIVVLIFIN